MAAFMRRNVAARLNASSISLPFGVHAAQSKNGIFRECHIGAPNCRDERLLVPIMSSPTLQSQFAFILQFSKDFFTNTSLIKAMYD